MTRLARRTCAIAAVICILSVTVSVSIEEGFSDRIAWLEEHLVPLASVEAQSGFEDMAPLGEMIGDARIVGLGESTHGTREHFQMKHRLVEYLVEELGFSWFAIEASTPEAHRLDAYVLGGDGDPKELIEGMYFWTWRTEEVLAMVEWMRAYNKRSDQKIHFTGFDMQTPDVAIEQVIEFLREVESPLSIQASELYPEVIDFQPVSPGGIASYKFPTSQALGKDVCFSAWVKTEDVNNGFAGLWWRIDGPTGVLASDSMLDRGIRATTDWTQCSIELAVPEDATAIHYGFYMTGTGAAWFDSTVIELDGTRFDASSFDLDFEKVGIAAFFKSDTVRLDRSASHSGEQSLLIAQDASADDSYRLVTDVESILRDMQANREPWLESHPASEVERALLYARIIVQYMKMRTAGESYVARDASMAANVAWLAEQYPTERIVLWAHNGHINRSPEMMGAHLAEQFGDSYLPIGFATATGQYYAHEPYGKRVHELQEPPGDSFEAHFAAAADPLLAVDLREVESDEPASAWLSETRPFRLVGAVAMDDQFFPTPLREYYDVIIFVEETTAARQL